MKYLQYLAALSKDDLYSLINYQKINPQINLFSGQLVIKQKLFCQIMLLFSADTDNFSFLLLENTFEY